VGQFRAIVDTARLLDIGKDVVAADGGQGQAARFRPGGELRHFMEAASCECGRWGLGLEESPWQWNPQSRQLSPGQGGEGRPVQLISPVRRKPVPASMRFPLPHPCVSRPAASSIAQGKGRRLAQRASRAGRRAADTRRCADSPSPHSEGDQGVTTRGGRSGASTSTPAW
jgi:hypothetical protein